MTNFLKLLLIIFLFVALTQLPVWAQTGNTVKVAMSDDQSIILERVLYTALRRAGYQMVSNKTGMRTAIADVNYGDAAILPTQTDGWDRMYPNLIKVPIAIDNVEYAAYTRSINNYPISKWADITGLKLGFRWQNEYIANNVSRANASKLITVNDITQLWDSLLNRETDVIILPRMPYFEYKLPQGIKRNGYVERQSVYSYVNNRYSDLVPLLEKAYNDMFEEGIIDKIHNGQQTTAIDENTKYIILHINSFNAQNEWERLQMEAVRSKLKLDTTLEYYSFYLNSNEAHSQASFNSIVTNMIRTEFVTRVPSLVITSGKEALDFVLDQYYLLFPNLPIIFYNIHGIDDSLFHGLEQNITGISQTISFNQVILEMLHLLPKTRRIYILNDHLHPRSIKIIEEIKEKIMTIKLPVEFVFNENKPFTEILKDIRSFGSDTLVLIGNYLSDSEDVFYSEIEVQKLVSSASINPVFSLTSSYIGHGTLGGLFLTTEMQNNLITSMAVDVINGKPLYRIPAIYDTTSINQWVFDYKIINKFNIKKNKLPIGYTVINHPVPIWESNPPQFYFLLTMAAILVLIIFGVMFLSGILVRKKADKDLHFALEAAETANKTKSTFLANMSHEIRTPMNSIIGFAELANSVLTQTELEIQQPGENHYKLKEYLVNILQSSELLLKIINDILDITKIESGTIELERIPFDLHEMLTYCHITIKPKIEEKGITFSYYAEPSINKKILGDPIKLRKAIINILSNAVKFTNSGSIKLTASLVNTEEQNSDKKSFTIHFEIKDTGIGMTPDHIKRSMEPFMQADDSVTRKFGGTGLGLPIAKNIIEMMGGKIAIESDTKTGSKFSFDLTFDVIEYNEAMSQENLLYVLDKPNFKGEILVCEDNLMNQQVICEHLSRMGLKTAVANNGKECVEIIQKRLNDGHFLFDLILMDVHMPIMDGFEASSIIAALGVKTPIIAVTANVLTKDMKLYKKSGMADCLSKPFTSQELWKCLIKFLHAENNSSANKNWSAEEDENFQKKTQTNFVRNNQLTYNHIEQAISSGDIKSAHRLAHTLKSNAGQIGEKKLQTAAALLEAMLSAELSSNSNTIKETDKKKLLQKEEIKLIESEIKSVLEKLSPLLAEIDKNNIEKTNDKQKIHEILDKLEIMLLNKNPECEDMRDEILSIPGAEELARQIDRFNFKQAVIELTKLKKEWG